MTTESNGNNPMKKENVSRLQEFQKEVSSGFQDEWVSIDKEIKTISPEITEARGKWNNHIIDGIAEGLSDFVTPAKICFISQD
jgi:hypothetical protein